MTQATIITSLQDGAIPPVLGARMTGIRDIGHICGL